MARLRPQSSDLTSNPDAKQVVRSLWKGADLPLSVLEQTSIHFTGPVHPLPSSYRIGVAAQACIAVVALAAKLLHHLREKKSSSSDASHRDAAQRLNLEHASFAPITVDSTHASFEFSSEKHIRVARGWTDNVADALLLSSLEAQALVNMCPEAAKEWDVLAGIYRTKPAACDKSSTASPHVRLHTNFPHHKIGLLKILGLMPLSKPADMLPSNVEEEQASRITREEVQEALLRWEGQAFERRAREEGMCATMFRRQKDWDSCEVGGAIREWVQQDQGLPFRITAISSQADDDVRVRKTCGSKREAAAQAVPPTSTHPSVHGNLLGPTSHLRALRVLDLSRVLAGPIAARTLALHGSQVLQISSQNLPNLPLAELDTARGKRCARLDLNEAQDRETFKQLIQGTDVVLQAYRRECKLGCILLVRGARVRPFIDCPSALGSPRFPAGSIASKGFSPSEAQQLRPGIVYASLSAYGFTGPWSNVRGFDSLTQTACGINHEEALSYARYRKSKQCEAEGDVNANVDSGAIEPRALPCQALDHAAAYMLAFGILASLIRHELSGSSKGSHVQVSLAGVAYWLASLGRVHGVEAWEVDPLPNVEAYLQASKIRSDSRADQEGEQVRATLFGVAHAANIQGVSTRYGEAPVRIGIDAAEWAA